VQYKQVARILIEVIQTPNVPIKVALAAARLFCRRDGFPRLGPYKKRSSAQMLWRLASGSTHNPEMRWKALQKLLAHAGARNSTQMSGSSSQHTERHEAIYQAHGL
jgi:hypothetical protein